MTIPKDLLVTLKKTLTSAGRNYSQLNKEALAILFGVGKFHSYLFERSFFKLDLTNHCITCSMRTKAYHRYPMQDCRDMHPCSMLTGIVSNTNLVRNLQMQTL